MNNNIVDSLAREVNIRALSVQAGMMHNTFSKVVDVDITADAVTITLKNGMTYRHNHSDMVRVLSGWLD